MNTLNKKLIVLALVATPFTAFATFKGTSVALFSVDAVLDATGGSIIMDPGAAGTATFAHPDLDINLETNVYHGAALHIEFTNGGYAHTEYDNTKASPETANADGLFHDMNMICVAETSFMDGKSTAYVSAQNQYASKKDIPQYNALFPSTTSLVYTHNEGDRTIRKDQIGNNFTCSFDLVSGETINEGFAGTYKEEVVVKLIPTTASITASGVSTKQDTTF